MAAGHCARAVSRRVFPVPAADGPLPRERRRDRLACFLVEHRDVGRLGAAVVVAVALRARARVAAVDEHLRRQDPARGPARFREGVALARGVQLLAQIVERAPQARQGLRVIPRQRVDLRLNLADHRVGVRVGLADLDGEDRPVGQRDAADVRADRVRHVGVPAVVRDDDRARLAGQRHLEAAGERLAVERRERPAPAARHEQRRVVGREREGDRLGGARRPGSARRSAAARPRARARRPSPGRAGARPTDRRARRAAARAARRRRPRRARAARPRPRRARPRRPRRPRRRSSCPPTSPARPWSRLGRPAAARGSSPARAASRNRPRRAAPGGRAAGAAVLTTAPDPPHAAAARHAAIIPRLPVRSVLVARWSLPRCIARHRRLPRADKLAQVGHTPEAGP